MLTNETKSIYTQILKAELQVSNGCTEPVAIAYCAAYAARILGRIPERYEVFCSGNIIKNVKAVIIPGTGGLRGIEAAAIAGAVSGDVEAELGILAGLTERDADIIRGYVKKNTVKVHRLESEHPLHIIVKVFAQDGSAGVELIDDHKGIKRIEKNGVELKRDGVGQKLVLEEEYCALNVSDILEYADTTDLEEVREVLERQIKCNCAISEEGLKRAYGAGVGPALAARTGKEIREHAKAAAAAASDARMNGCSLPVVINSGSGNQGIAASVPVVIYAQELKIPHEKLLRALCVSNLITIHQKTGIGKLSAYCGAVCAATGAACGIAYMQEESFSTISQLIINSIATAGGIICDGAKSSCAAKIATALEAAFLGYNLAKVKRGYRDGEGIVKKDVERTIAGLGRIARKGMRSTDNEVLNLMLED